MSLKTKGTLHEVCIGGLLTDNVHRTPVHYLDTNRQVMRAGCKAIWVVSFDK